MSQEIDISLDQLSVELAKAQSSSEVDLIKSHYLGKKGLLTQKFQAMGSLTDEKRKEMGATLNVIKTNITNLLDKRSEEISTQEINQKLLSESIDVTLPPNAIKQGSIHPISFVMNEITQIFADMGFGIESGPDIETDDYNFTALNIHANHPARQMHDTFYVDDTEQTLVLRTHTSPVQIRTMEAHKPPFRFIAPGRTYRCDSDMTHSPMFHQIEAVCIDKDINMGHLKWCLNTFLHKFFDGKNIQIRMRPSFFPFTEPSAEVDISMDGGKKWLEILGCGMIHPSVLKNVGIDSNEYQGFALGLGIERCAMLKYGINDLRTFFDGDVRWSAAHGFKFFDIMNLLKTYKR